MNATQRAAKRHKRENRDNKGVSTEAKRQKRNAAVRDARRMVGNIHGGDEGLILLAASMMSKR